jgi:hypothetical protein
MCDPLGAEGEATPATGKKVATGKKALGMKVSDNQ